MQVGIRIHGLLRPSLSNWKRFKTNEKPQKLQTSFKFQYRRYLWKYLLLKQKIHGSQYLLFFIFKEMPVKCHHRHDVIFLS